MKLGIVGLPNVGKSTLFNAITKAGAESANYPFCTIDPNIGVVNVPDERLEHLTQLYNSRKKVPATIDFYDIAGLVKGASQGEGLGNQFLANIREVDAIVEVLRCFEDPNVIHVDGAVDPLRDIETIHTELIFADLELVEKLLGKTRKNAAHDKKLATQLSVLERIHAVLLKGKSARLLSLNDDEKQILKSFQLLSTKPILYVANIAEEEIRSPEENPYYRQLIDFAAQEHAEVVPVSAKIEQELSELDADEKKEFLEELEIEQSGIDLLIRASYKLLGLISFLTTGEDETRAWTIKKETKAVDAAAKIHTDISRGFIRAETIQYDELMKYDGSLTKAREAGAMRLEGKEYLVQDGDIIHFRFNV